MGAAAWQFLQLLSWQLLMVTPLAPQLRIDQEVAPNAAQTPAGHHSLAAVNEMENFAFSHVFCTDAPHWAWVLP